MHKPDPGCLRIGIKLSKDDWDELQRFGVDEESVAFARGQSRKPPVVEVGVAERPPFKIGYEYNLVTGELWLTVIEMPPWIGCSGLYGGILDLIQRVTAVRRQRSLDRLDRDL